MKIPYGMIDTQVNGYLGFDYSDPAFAPDWAEKICTALVKKGTLQHFATIVTRPTDVILRNIDSIVRACRESEVVKKCLTGIHIEGNFISSEDGPRGAHDRRYVRSADIKEFDSWLEHSCGLLKYITVGAEAQGIVRLIEHAVSCGVAVALGHTGATSEQIERAVDAGASVSTHLGNGVFQTLDRFENPLWPQLRDERLAAGVIADMCHVTPDLLWIISRCKKPERIILVSDLAPCAGLPKGRLKWGSMDVEIAGDGSVRLAGTPYLAGAGAVLLEDVFNWASCTGFSIQSAVESASIVPIKKYGLEFREDDYLETDSEGKLLKVCLAGSEVDLKN